MAQIGYEIKVVRSKSKSQKPDHDLKTPYKSKDNATTNGEYFIVELLAQKQLINGINVRRQRRPYTEVIFNSANTKLVFDDIQTAIAGKAFKEEPSGLLISTSEMGYVGHIVEAPCGFVYTVMQGDGTPLKISAGPHAGENATRSVVRVFVSDEEDEEVVIAKAIARIPEDTIIKANANDNPEETT